ncbi:unnamed protein product [Arctogadus glacialis]
METDSYDNLTSTAAPVANNQRPTNPHKYMNTLSLIILCLVFLFGTVGNGLVIYVTGFRMKRTVNSIWFLNLALADFLFTSFLIFLIISLAKDYHWPFGWFMCKLSSVIAIGNMFASVFFLTAISVDRCLCTWVVVWSQNHRTVRKAQLICAGIWLASLACSIPYGHSRCVYVRNHFTVCALSQTANKLALTHFQFFMGFLIPMLAITGSYVAIGMRMRRFNRAKSRKSLRIIIAIILAFVVCWVPYHVHKYIEAYGNKDKIVTIRRFLGPLSSNLTTVNSCLNPLLYVFMCDEFIKKLKQSLFHVLETALAEDYLSYASNNSRSNISRLFRRSESSSANRKNETSATIAETFTQVPTGEE